MLALTVKVGESVLAEKDFELRCIDMSSASFVVDLEVAQSVSVEVSDRGRTISYGLAHPQEPKRFTLGYDDVLILGECRISFERWRGQAVKFLLDAPKSVRFTRPARHGTSLGRA